jgi:hypothetical protein
MLWEKNGRAASRREQDSGKKVHQTLKHFAAT